MLTAYLGQVEQVVSFSDPLSADAMVDLVVRGRQVALGLRKKRGLDHLGHRSLERCVDYWGASLEVREEGVGSQVRRAVLVGSLVGRRGSGDIDSRGGVAERSRRGRAGCVTDIVDDHAVLS